MDWTVTAAYAVGLLARLAARVMRAWRTRRRRVGARLPAPTSPPGDVMLVRVLVMVHDDRDAVRVEVRRHLEDVHG